MPKDANPLISIPYYAIKHGGIQYLHRRTFIAKGNAGRVSQFSMPHDHGLWSITDKADMHILCRPGSCMSLMGLLEARRNIGL